MVDDSGVKNCHEILVSHRKIFLKKKRRIATFDIATEIYFPNILQLFHFHTGEIHMLQGEKVRGQQVKTQQYDTWLLKKPNRTQ